MRALDSLGEAYEWQAPLMGGRQIRGGSVADFLLRQYGLIISVIGMYYHMRIDTRARDALQRIALESQGLHTVYIDESDALKNAKWYVQEAIAGRDWSRYAQVL